MQRLILTLKSVAVPEHLPHNQYSVTAAINRNGTVDERYAYSPYGETTVLNSGYVQKNNNLSTIDNEYTYTGRRLDPSGLMYFRARYYSPQLGQFISRDPLGYVDGMSQYRAYFVPGAVDPTGTCIECITSFGEWGCYESGICKPNPFNVLDATSLDGLGVSMADLLPSPPSVSSPSVSSPSGPGKTVAISFEEDFVTRVAGAYSYLTYDCQISLSAGKPDWKRAIIWLEICLGDSCIKDLAFTGHGNQGIAGPITSGSLKLDPGQKEFFDFIKKRLCRNKTVQCDLKMSNVAMGISGKKLIKDIAAASGANTVGYDDQYAVIPFGSRCEACEDGTLNVDPPERCFNGTWRETVRDLSRDYLGL